MHAVGERADVRADGACITDSSRRAYEELGRGDLGLSGIWLEAFPAAWHAREGSSAVLRSARMRARADAPGAALGRWRVGACMRHRAQLQLPLPPVMSRQKWRADLMYVHMD